MKEEIVLWTPLVGFDRDLPDRGARQYLDSVGVPPSGISLFVFNLDIVTMHPDGMPDEQVFPRDYCNYYGSVRNEFREIQPWTNYDLRQLIGELRKNGVESYLGVMGMHTHIQAGEESGCFGYVARQKFLEAHPELEMVGARWSGNNYILKRFEDGTYFEDYLIRKILSALNDYGADGIHMSDGLFPPCIQIFEGDFSDDMFGQFREAAELSFPDEITVSLSARESAGVAARAAFVWEHYREEWIRFVSGRWTQFFDKLCTALHAAGKKVLVNNAWTAEPFEALYRFGIDYRALAEAGVDAFCIEDQATSIRSTGDDTFPYKIHEYMALPLLMRAYAPQAKQLAINFAKDSTEECSLISHLPCANEREIFSLSAPLWYTNKGVQRAIDGFFVCLADAIKPDEWKWLNRHYEAAFRVLPEHSLSPVLVWSDRLIWDFLPGYIRDRRWSAHKLLSELSKRGGKIGGVVRAEDLADWNAPAALFVPNAELFSSQERKTLANSRVPVLMVGLEADPLGTGPDFTLEDEAEPDRALRLKFSVYGGSLDPISLKERIQEESNWFAGAETDARETYWYHDMLFRKVSEGFLSAAAQALHLLSVSPVESAPDFPLSAYLLPDGAVRLIAENDNFAQYRAVIVRTQRKIRKIVNTGDFPAQPPKLLLPNGAVTADTTPDRSLLNEAKGFRMNMPPAGVSVMDVWLKD